MGDTYDAYQPTSSMLSKLWVIRGTAVEMIVLSTATQNVAKQSTMEIMITLGSFGYRDVSSDSRTGDIVASARLSAVVTSFSGTGLAVILRAHSHIGERTKIVGHLGGKLQRTLSTTGGQSLGEI